MKIFLFRLLVVFSLFGFFVQAGMCHKGEYLKVFWILTVFINMLFSVLYGMFSLPFVFNDASDKEAWERVHILVVAVGTALVGMFGVALSS
jgi:hypothetical protein